MPGEVWSGSGEACPLGTSFQRSSWPCASQTEILGRRRSLGDGRMEKEAPRLWPVPNRAETDWCDRETSPRGDLVRQEARSGRLPVGARGSRVPPWPLRPLRHARGLSGEVQNGDEATSSTSIPPPPPLQRLPRPYDDSASRPIGRVRSRLFWATRRPPDQRGLLVRLPERQFPAESEVGWWVWEHLRCGDWDEWSGNLRVCLPRAPQGLLEGRLIQFLEWGGEAARDLRQPDFFTLAYGGFVLPGFGAVGIFAARFHVAETADATHQGGGVA